MTRPSGASRPMTRAGGRVLVIGGMGYIGRRLCPALRAAGWQPVVFDRGAGRGGVRGDRRAAGDLRRALARGPFAGVIDLVAYRGGDTELLAGLLRERPCRLVHLGTAAVYRGAPTVRVDEAGGLLREDDGHDYGGAKAACERVLWRAENGVLSPVALRVAPLMGPDDPVSREFFVARRILEGRTVRIPAAPTDRLSALWVGDLVACLVAALRPEVPPGPYNLAQSEDVTLERHVAAIARLCGRPARVRWLDREELAAAGLGPFAFPYAPGTPAWLDCARARAALGFSPTPYAEALPRALARLDAPPGTRPSWPGRGTTQSRLAGTHEILAAAMERDAFGGGTAPPRPEHPDTLLEALRPGGRQGAADGAAPPGYRWAPGTRILVADSVAARLGLPAAPAPPAAGDPPSCEAVLEADAERAGGALLYSRHQALRARGYGHGNAPLRVALLACAAAPRPLPEPADGERLLLLRATPADAGTWAAWTRAWEDAGAVRWPRAGAAARIFLAGTAGAATRWDAVFDWTRVALTAGLAGPGGPVVLEPSFPDRPLLCAPARHGGNAAPGAPVLFRVNGRYVALPPGGGALELPRALAAVVEAAADDRPLAERLDRLARGLGLGADRALALWRRGIDEAERHGLQQDRFWPTRPKA
ncbi:NAD-dependent epimerase/dehydratase family protein [Azospirillum sp. ST 5-10]|uniref:NAD-dependent epimerase/dehydratase family protein n=1 Tax=unclassified Azospirillum TaxID=2630922 RepID=UPI003F49B76A